MDHVGDQVHVTLSAPTTGVLAKGTFVGKPEKEHAQVVEGGVVRGLHVAGAFLDVTVMSGDTSAIGVQC